MRSVSLEVLISFRDALLAEAVQEGWVTPPALAAAGSPPRKPVMKMQELLREIESDRQDR